MTSRSIKIINSSSTATEYITTCAWNDVDIIQCGENSSFLSKIGFGNLLKRYYFELINNEGLGTIREYVESILRAENLCWTRYIEKKRTME